MNKYGPGERLNSARFNPKRESARVKVSVWDLSLAIVDRVFWGAVIGYLIYVIVARWDIVVYFLTFGGIYK